MDNKLLLSPLSILDFDCSLCFVVESRGSVVTVMAVPEANDIFAVKDVFSRKEVVDDIDERDKEEVENGRSMVKGQIFLGDNGKILKAFFSKSSITTIFLSSVSFAVVSESFKINFLQILTNIMFGKIIYVHKYC